MGLENISVIEGDEIVWQDGSYVGGVAGIAGGSQRPDWVTLMTTPPFKRTNFLFN